MAKTIHLGKSKSGELRLPLDAVTQTFSILAKRGVGKTYTAAVMAEGMLEANMQVVVIDPLDAWWGLRSSADGRKGGYPITIFGGEHGDLPLHYEAAETLADLVAEERVSCVLSIDHLRKNKQCQFVMAFAERLYYRKSKTKFKTPVHIFIDEADRFAPQRVQKGLERMLGAVDDLVRRGRVKGIGVTTITQRAAVLNKDVLTQSEVLIALQNISPQDRKAIGAWVEEHDAHGQKKEFEQSLSSLPIGTAWIWSPGWLKLFKKIKVRRRKTFDSSKTPELGKVIKPPKRLAKVDLVKLGARMDKIIQQQKEDDPKLLKQRIRELEKEARKKQPARPAEPAKSLVLTEEFKRRLEVEAAKIHEQYRLERLQEKRTLHLKADRILGSLEKATGSVKEFVGELSRAKKREAEAPRPSLKLQPLVVHREPVKAPVSRPDANVEGLGKCPRAMLAVLVQRTSEATTKAQLSLLSGYKMRSSTFRNGLSVLRTFGYLAEAGGELRATQAGVDAAGDVDPLPQGEELQRYWMGRIGKCPATMLDALISVYPAGLNKRELGIQSGYSIESSTFRNGLSVLRTMQLIKEDNGMIESSEDLF